MIRQGKEKEGHALTDEMVNKASNDHYYIKVGPKKGTLVLTGAARRWKTYPQDIYVPAYRIVGNVDDVAEALRISGIKDEEIRRSLNEAYTADNYNTTKKQQFEEELELYKQWKKTAAAKKDKNESKYTLDDLDRIIDALTEARPAKRTQKKRGSANKKTSESNLKKRFLEALEKLGTENAVYLDVSNMKDGYKNVKGVKVLPGPNSKKVYVEGIPIISSNPQNYATVVRLFSDVLLGLGFDVNQVLMQYQQASSEKTKGKKTQKSRTNQQRARSPRQQTQQQRTRSPRQGTRSPRQGSRSPRQGSQLTGIKEFRGFKSPLN